MEQGSAGATVRNRRRLALPALLLGSFMGVLDPFVVTVALPAIRSDLGATAAQTQWMVAAYGTAYAVGLVVGGRLGDRCGRRRLFLVGMSAYAAASVAAGVAPATGALIGARLAQGLAAAAMLPQVLSIIRATFPQPARDRAVGWYGATIGLGVVCGPAFGGLLVGADVAGLGWRSVFLVNLPLGALVVGAAALAVPESRARERHRLDLLGAVLGAVTLLAFLVPISRGPETGWPWWTVALLACSPALIAGFLWYERRLERLRRAPIVPPRLFSERRFATGIVAILLLYAAGASAPLVFVLTYHLQDGLGASPLQTGLVFAPLGLGFAVASATAPRSYRRFGRAVPITGSCVVAAALGGIAAVAALAPVAVQPVLVAALMLVAGTGQGLATNPLVALVLAAAPDDAVGVASGVLLTTTQVGNSLGVTGIGAVFFAVLRPDAPAATAHAQALAWSAALLAVVTAAALVVIATLERRSSPSYLPNSCTQ